MSRGTRSDRDEVTATGKAALEGGSLGGRRCEDVRVVMVRVWCDVGFLEGIRWRGESSREGR